MEIFKKILGLGIVVLTIGSFFWFLIHKSIEQVNDSARDIQTDGSVLPEYVLPQQNVTPIGARLIANKDATKLAEDFYVATDDSDSYDIFYDAQSNKLTVMLYAEPLAFSRSLAELKLQSLFEELGIDICQLDVTVLTNIYVSPQYAGVNLGLSFCPNGVSLE